MTQWLGMPLQMALDMYRALGQDAPEIIETRAPRGECAQGTPRVVRVSEDGRRLTTARFPDRANAEEDEP